MANRVTFFTDSKGNQSMSRLGMFVNIVLAFLVTMYVVVYRLPINDYMLLIFGLWSLAYGGKAASAHFESKDFTPKQP